MIDKKAKKRGRPRKSSSWTAELLLERAAEYFKKCDDHTKSVATKDGIVQLPDPLPYVLEGLCDHLWILRQEFALWRKRSDALGRAANMLHQKITANRASGALRGEQNSSFAQFMLKNCNPEDYRDKIDVENAVTPETQELLDAWRQMWKKIQ